MRRRSDGAYPDWPAAVILLVALLGGVVLLAPSAAEAALTFSASRALIYANADNGGTASSQPVKVTVGNGSGSTQYWLAISTAAWLTPEPRVGSAAGGQVSFKVDATNLAPGRHDAYVIFLDLANFAYVGFLPVSAKVCEGVCLGVNAGDARHTISPLLFGTQIEWLASGGGTWDNAVTPRCDDAALRAGAPRQTLVDELSPIGIRLLGYPAGTPSDFFNWYEAIGPVNARVPQINPWESTAQEPVRECPVYGPDEAAELARTLDSQLMIITNTANGTAADAAAWLRHYRESGVSVRYWAVGNENYIPGASSETPYYFAKAYMAPLDYAAAFDAFAGALRQEDPGVEVGFIASRGFRNWNLGALTRISEPADFISVHLLDPSSCDLTTSDQVFAAMLTVPETMAADLQTIKADAARFALNPANRNLDLAITEHGTLFFACYPGYELETLRRNRVLASALYSALSFHVFMSDPKIRMAMHVRPAHPLFQAQLNTSMLDGYSDPVRSAFYHVFGLYAAAAGDTLLASTTQNAPTFSAPSYGEFPARTGLPVLHTMATRTHDVPGVRLYVVNRSLQSEVTARVSFDGLPAPIRALTAVIVTADSFDAVNTPAEPDAIRVQALPLPATAEFDFAFPAHSLVVFFAQ